MATGATQPQHLLPAPPLLPHPQPARSPQEAPPRRESTLLPRSSSLGSALSTAQPLPRTSSPKGAPFAPSARHTAPLSPVSLTRSSAATTQACGEVTAPRSPKWEARRAPAQRPPPLTPQPCTSWAPQSLVTVGAVPAGPLPKAPPATRLKVADGRADGHVLGAGERAGSPWGAKALVQKPHSCLAGTLWLAEMLGSLLAGMLALRAERAHPLTILSS